MVTQDLAAVQGDATALQLTALNGAGQPIDISGVTDIKWSLSIGPAGPALLTKTKLGGGITFATDGKNGVFVVALTRADLELVSGVYCQEAATLDVGGNPTTVAIGTLTISASAFA
jgi:hypothetical protein